MALILGCMRLSTEGPLGERRDEGAAVALVALALRRGITALDTARAYDDSERVVRRAIESAGVPRSSVRVITKCGMTRPDGRWVPDGRRQRVLDDAEASAAALGGPPDLLLLHAPDPSVPIETTARALAEVLERGLARAVGLSNARRAVLDAARAIVPISGLQIALGAHADEAIRSGLVQHALALGVEVMAYAPFGGPKRSPRLARDPALRGIAGDTGVSPHRVFLSWLEALEPRLSIVIGPRTEATLLDCLSPGAPLTTDHSSALARRFEGVATLRPTSTTARGASPREDAPEVVVAMGLAGSGKSSFAEAWMAERGARGQRATRLNRDALGGTLRGIAKRLHEELASGVGAVILDNTYLGRAARADVLRIAARHGARTRCVHFDTPVDEALHNVALRMLSRHGRLVEPSEWAALAKRDPGLVLPTSLYRMTRELEPPSLDEGWDALERVPFVRRPVDGRDALVLSLELPPAVAAEAIATAPPGAPILFIGFRPEGARAGWVDEVRARVDALAAPGPVELGVCTHGGGPPVCYCRPPLPGLFLAFAAKHGADARRTTFVTNVSACRTMAQRLGAHVAFVD